MKDILRFILTGTYLGKMAKMPGTWGTLWGIPLVFAMSHLSDVAYLALCILFVILGIYAIDIAYPKSANEDPQEIVWDEIVGYAVSMALLPTTVFYYVAAFLMFRLFDIWKPYPISYLDQKLKGGYGVMADDIAAALVTNFLLQIVFVLWGNELDALF